MISAYHFSSAGGSGLEDLLLVDVLHLGVKSEDERFYSRSFAVRENRVAHRQNVLITGEEDENSAYSNRLQLLYATADNFYSMRKATHLSNLFDSVFFR